MSHLDYERISQAIAYLHANFREQPSLQQIASSVNLSEFHFQRLFKRWVGISAKRFLQFLTLEHAKSLLDKSTNLLDTAFESGLSGPGRLHDLFVTLEAISPGEYKAQGAGLRVDYGIHGTPFGRCLLASTDRGICGLSFLSDESPEPAIKELDDRWRGAKLRRNQKATGEIVRRIFKEGGRGRIGGRSSPVDQAETRPEAHLYVKGSNFQIKVWEALLRIPLGHVVSYQHVACAVGLPLASRAVGQALAVNPVGFLIPCHRVIRKSGLFGRYRWGAERKAALLGWECVQKAETTASGH